MLLGSASQLATPASLRLALLALGGAPHAGGAVLPLGAQWEAAARVVASAKLTDSEAWTIQVRRWRSCWRRTTPSRPWWSVCARSRSKPCI
jgi:hypothetical protein